MATLRADQDYDDTTMTTAPATSVQTRSIASVLSILSAIASFYMSSRGREFVGLFLAVVAIGAGLLGGLRALSPRVSGGILSIIAVLLGVIAVVVSLVALVV